MIDTKKNVFKVKFIGFTKSWFVWKKYKHNNFCLTHTTSGYWSIRLESGEQRVDNINNSMNSAQYYSAIVITTPSLFTSSHCTFSNNKVSHYVCIYFHSSSGTISISFANIVKNNSPLNYGVILVWGAGQERW